MNGRHCEPVRPDEVLASQRSVKKTHVRSVVSTTFPTWPACDPAHGPILIQITFGTTNARHPARLHLSGECMLEFLLVFHSDAGRMSATAILRADREEEAIRKARDIARHDGRTVELWRDQTLIARFAGQDDRAG